MDHHILNIKHPAEGNTAEYWLGRRNLAPVFFGQSTVQQLLADRGVNGQRLGGGARLFAELGLDERHQASARCITISAGEVWCYRFTGRISALDNEAIEFLRNGQHCIDVPKAIPVAVEERIPIYEVPLIVASLRVNQHFCRGTFAHINPERYPGNVAALDWLWGAVPEPLHRLQCLSSIELETLIAKLLEEQGAFVPAYKGGFLHGVDLFAYADSAAVAQRSRLPFVRRTDGRLVLSVQVKTRIGDVGDVQAWLAGGDERVLITIEDERHPALADLHGVRYFTREWVEQSLGSAPVSNAWLDRSLNWLGAIRNAAGQ
ncbi:hypothetical protein [Methylibium sp.]|uniref:hypothetical protein n=1 Tax=Methylibium sp. TaxID=2067992 RepID=UPI003BAACB37